MDPALNTRERLERGATILSAVEPCLSAKRVVDWELLDLEIADIDERVAEIRRAAGTGRSDHNRIDY